MSGRLGPFRPATRLPGGPQDTDSAGRLRYAVYETSAPVLPALRSVRDRIDMGHPTRSSTSAVPGAADRAAPTGPLPDPGPRPEARRKGFGREMPARWAKRATWTRR